MKAYGSVAPRPVPADMGPTGSQTYPVGAKGPDHPTRYHPRGAQDPGPRLLASAHGNSVTAVVADRERLHNARILIVDDCVLHRDSLAAALAANGMPAVGCAWDLVTLVTAIRETVATVVLLNIATRDSAALLRTARATDPRIHVVVLGVSDDDESEVIACAEAGAAGYHTRTESFEDLLSLLRKAAAGEPFCSPRISSILLRRLSALATQTQQAPGPKELVLTTREAQILQMLRLGLSNRDIADRLCIAVHTVKNHVHNILTKLGVGTRGEAVALARTLGNGTTVPEDQA